jgi:hypothetical protein
MTQKVFQRVTVAKAISVSLWVRRSASVELGGNIIVYQPYILTLLYAPGSTPLVRTRHLFWYNAALTQGVARMCNLFQHPRHRPGVCSLWFAA